MSRFVPPFILMAALVAPAAALRAQAAPDPRADDAAALRQAGAASSPDRSLHRPPAGLPAIQSAGRTPMSINYPLWPNGAVASLGWRHVIEGQEWAPPASGLAASSTRFGRPDSTLGAMLSLTFR